MSMSLLRWGAGDAGPALRHTLVTGKRCVCRPWARHGCDVCAGAAAPLRLSDAAYNVTAGWTATYNTHYESNLKPAVWHCADVEHWVRLSPLPR